MFRQHALVGLHSATDGGTAAPSAGVAVMVVAAAMAAAKGCRGAAAAAAHAEPVYTRAPLPRTAVVNAADRVATRAVTTYTSLWRVRWVQGAKAADKTVAAAEARAAVRRAIGGGGRDDIGVSNTSSDGGGVLSPSPPLAPLLFCPGSLTTTPSLLRRPSSPPSLAFPAPGLQRAAPPPAHRLARPHLASPHVDRLPAGPRPPVPPRHPHWHACGPRRGPVVSWRRWRGHRPVHQRRH